MEISLILAHPDRDSFNHAIAGAALVSLRRNGHTVFFHDLYGERFDPLLPRDEIPKNAPLDPLIQNYCAEIARSDGIIVVHPNWWGQPPAVLKGWIDRILRPGVAYEFAADDSGEGIPIGLLKAGTALVFEKRRCFSTPWRPSGGIACSACAASGTSTAGCLGPSSPAHLGRGATG